MITLLLLFAAPTLSQVKSIKAETADGLVITTWLAGQPVQMGKDIAVYFRIENKTSRPVYLVKKEGLEFESSSDEIIVNPFTVGFDEHGATDYSFGSIRERRTYEGQFVIPAKRINRDGVWYLVVGLAFVNDIRGLQLRQTPGRDPAAFRGLLAERATPVSLGKLYLLVK